MVSWEKSVVQCTPQSLLVWVFPWFKVKDDCIRIDQVVYLKLETTPELVIRSFLLLQLMSKVPVQLYKLVSEQDYKSLLLD